MRKNYTQNKLRNYAGLLLVLFLSFSGLKGMAQPLLVENFDYPIGDLLTAHGWTAHSGAGTESIDVTNGLLFSGYAGSGIGGAANLDNSGEDDHKTFSEQTTGIVYAAFVLQTQTPNAGGYFIHFGQGTIATTYFTRLYMNAAGDGIALGLGNTPPATYTPITPGVPALVVLKLDIVTKVSSYFVFSTFPSSEPATPNGTVTETASFTNVGSIGLRQFNATQRMIVDGIRVATTWADAVTASQSTAPVISASPGSLGGFAYEINNGPSASQSYSLSGVNLVPASGNLTVTPSANYEISLNNTTFTQAVQNVAYTGGTLIATPVYVRLKAGLAGGLYNGEIIANAGGGAPTSNVTLSGTVEAPASTTLPYTEDFTTGLGLCYTKSVAGPAQYWKHSATNGYAYMNGYNTGVLEEDWLILPAVNFNNYFNASMTFESFMNYGADDADNYFKLVYSTDYAGIGDPTLATWTELPFEYPTENVTWTPSGTVDLTNISGSSVYIAFKYHYNATFYKLWQVDNISIIAGDTPVLTATPATLTGFSYEVGSGPSAIQTYQISGSNLVGSGNVAVTAPVDYEISLNGTTFGTSLSLPFAATEITGQPVTVSVRLKAGLAIGVYNNELITHTGGGVTNYAVSCSGNVIDMVPVFSSVTVPSYIQGINGTNNQRVPFAYSATISNLYPNTIYRYFNKVVVGTDSPTSNGAGNTIFANADGTFTRVSSTSMGTPGQYGEFTTNADGEFTGLFITEPSGNDRFTPGNELFMRIMLNGGNDGTTVLNRLTTTVPTTVINFGNQNEAGMGTGIRCISLATPGNYVFLYNNVTGTGRPVGGTTIETTGIDFTTPGSYAEFYSSLVEGVDGSWGSIVPNILPEGIRYIEERSRIDGSVVAVHTSVDGVWGIYDTRNPFGGETDILLIDLMPVGEPILSVSPSVLNGFSYIEGAGPSTVKTYALSGTELEGSGNITVTAPADYEISADGTTFTTMLEFPFADGVITGQPVTVSVRLIAGLPIGDYNGETILNAGGGATDKTVTCSGSVLAISQAEITNVTLPLYIQGINGTNSSRVPTAYRATLANLTPNATYRFFNKIVLESDAFDYNGAGNCIYVAADGTFTRTSSTSLVTPGEYGEFTTDASGNFTGWFITEPSGNARFTPGNQLFARISLNDGLEGTEVATRLTTVDFVTVLEFGTEALPTQGTAIRGISNDNPKDFVFLFDNVEGSGRPLCATHIETSGVDFIAPGSYAPFYADSVAGVNGSWGGIVPNMNDAGIQHIEIRDLTDGSLVDEYNMASGIWIETDTHNPTGGLENVLVIDLTSIGINTPEAGTLNITSAGKEIRVLTTDASIHTLSLFNLQGQVIFSQQLSGSQSYSLSLNVPAGIYVARVTSASTIKAQKLMIR